MHKSNQIKIPTQSAMGKPLNYPQLRWTLSEMETLIGATALTQSPNHWNPLKGLYLRNVLLVSQKEDSGYIACQRIQTGAKTEAVGLVAPHDISSEHTAQEMKKRYSRGNALLFSGELGC